MIGGRPSVQEYIKLNKKIIPIPEKETSGLRKLCLNLHNEKRALHNAGPLGYNDELETFAQEWAEALIRSKKFEHRPSNPYGENLYLHQDIKDQMPTNEQALSRAVRLWYDEVRAFKMHFGKELMLKQLIDMPETGHFTQLVWKESTAVGLGIARGKDAVVVCCNYAPSGNVINKFVENVAPAVRSKRRK
ncbi:hypothetical protein WDU94_007935 [Cyamophila willieti]